MAAAEVHVREAALDAPTMQVRVRQLAGTVAATPSRVGSHGARDAGRVLAAHARRSPGAAVEEWESWPFDGDLRVRELAPPVAAERPRNGTGGVDCWRCAHEDDENLWSNEPWTVRSFDKPSGLPVVLLLETREHVDFTDLDEDRASELGPLLLKIQRAVLTVPGVGNVHVGRWGEGSEHCHVWFMARPARMEQFRSSFAAIWDDVLPPVREEVWRDNLEIARRELNSG